MNFKNSTFSNTFLLNFSTKMGMWPLLQFKIWKNILFYNYFGKKKQNLGELSIYKSKYVSGKNRTHFCRYLKSLEVYCIMNWFWFAKTLFKDSLPVYERVNIDQTFQIFIWYLLCSFRQWNICYLFINLANNGSLIFFWFLVLIWIWWKLNLVLIRFQTSIQGPSRTSVTQIFRKNI